MSNNNISKAQRVLGCSDLAENIDFFINTLGFCLVSISPANNPRTANLQTDGLSVSLVIGEEENSKTVIRLPLTDSQEVEKILRAPNGVRIALFQLQPFVNLPEIEQSFVISHPENDGENWVMGRADMEYRDLIPLTSSFRKF